MRSGAKYGSVPASMAVQRQERRGFVRGRVMIAGVAVLLASGRTHAQVSAVDQAARRELLEQAQRADSEGDHASALRAATRAMRIQATTSVREFIARQQIALGRVAQGYANATLCAHDAEVDEALRNRAAILDSCRAMVAQSEARIGRIVIEVPEGQEDNIEVTVNGQQLSSAMYGVSYAVDPGSITVHARGRDGRTMDVTVEVAAGASQTVPVQLRAPGAHGGHGSSARPTVLPPPALPPPTRPGDAHGPGPWPFVVMGVGAAGAATGVVFYLLARNEATRCMRTVGCNAVTSQQTVNRFTVVSNVAWISGAVVAVAGLIWWIAAPSGRSTARRPATTAWVLPHPDGAEAGFSIQF